MDVSAGPCEYGPRTVGEGDVSEYTLLSGANRWHRAETFHSERRGDLAGQLANQVWIARQHIFLPSLFHARSTSTSSTFSSITSSSSSSSSSPTTPTVNVIVHHLQSEMSTSKKQSWTSFTKSIRSIPLPGQQIRITHNSLLLA
jgi:hypothetical protein